MAENARGAAESPGKAPSKRVKEGRRKRRVVMVSNRLTDRVRRKIFRSKENVADAPGWVRSVDIPEFRLG